MLGGGHATRERDLRLDRHEFRKHETNQTTRRALLHMQVHRDNYAHLGCLFSSVRNTLHAGCTENRISH